eukprot:TRINITY_DN56804_c0_g1_i1.p1 TRINITY_DN56804_c0_g1~~TRINITY_DN56804_c0_g1_i1.p1  ORF type:complete len:219 (-),score=30.08 TRINITY_DN56804_c0_g1_i1:143-799(-)
MRKCAVAMSMGALHGLLQVDAVVLVTEDGPLSPGADLKPVVTHAETDVLPGATKLGVTAAVAAPVTQANSTMGKSDSSVANERHHDHLTNLLAIMKPEAELRVDATNSKPPLVKKSISVHSQRMQRMLSELARYVGFLIDPLRTKKFPASFYTFTHGAFGIGLLLWFVSWFIVGEASVMHVLKPKSERKEASSERARCKGVRSYWARTRPRSSRPTSV